MSTREHRSAIGHAAQGAFVIVAILFAALMFAVGLYVGQNSSPEHETGGGGVDVAQTDTGETGGDDTANDEETEEQDPGQTDVDEGETETEAEGGGEGGGEDGAQIFASAGCGNCHMLEAAGSSGSVGPNLDDTDLDREGIEQVVRNGRGAMPAFEGSLDDDQIEAVSDYVAGDS